MLELWDSGLSKVHLLQNELLRTVELVNSSLGTIDLRVD